MRKTYVFANPKRDDDRVAVEAADAIAAEKSIMTLAAASGFKLAAIHKCTLMDFHFGRPMKKEICWECTGEGRMLGFYPCKVCQTLGWLPVFETSNEVPDCSPAGERWTDPAGGTHDDGDEDPALDYE